MGAKIVLKMNEQSNLGRLFLIRGGLLRCLIFDEISIGKKRTQNQTMGAKVFQKVQFSEARRNARGQRGTTVVQELEALARIWKKIRIGICSLTRRDPPRGGGGLN